MAPERWQEIERLYHSALECAPERRAAFLKEAAGGDEDLRREVASLLEQADKGMLDRPGWQALGQEGLEDLAAEQAGNSPKSPPKSIEIDAGQGAGLTDNPATPPTQGAGVSASLIGQTISHYRIVEKLGAGGMGVVYKAEDIRLRRFVALKFMPDENGNDPDALSRFEREARSASALSHPNICTIHEIEEHDDRPVIVMELLEGKSLNEKIRAGPIPIDELVDFAIQISDALEAAHAKRIIHRDIKPGNIFITLRRQAKILDFGLAKRAASGDPSSADVTRAPTLTMDHQLTGAGYAVGTVPYMSPEQVRAKDLDARTDLFSFGVVLYEMATGKLPFRGESSGAVLDSILNRVPVAPVRLNPDVPAELERIIGKCLEKDRDLRYQHASEIRADLQRLKRDTESAGTIAAAQEEIATKRPRRWTAIVLAVATLLVAGAGLAWRFGAPRGPVTSASEYIRLTNFNDSATAPTLSPDGRMVAFFRGGGYFLGSGQIYVKLLPDGESKQLTFDSNQKYDPVFTPDASRVAYTILSLTDGRFDTWTVPVLGGTPARLMVNAAGLSWIGPDRVLFSEVMSGTALHMGIVTAKESRAEERTIYFPAHVRAMAHYSWLSPDRGWVLTVEMNGFGEWQRCRVIPMDGNPAGVQVGPEGACRAAAWSRDGRWIYLNVNVDGSTHLWRQRWRDRAPEGNPEQITFGPAEEEGLAVAPDGKSLIASVGGWQRSVWTHDAAGNHEVSLEGAAEAPKLSPDGKRLYYLLRRSTSSDASELWRRDLASGKSDPLLTGQRIVDYDVSHDEARVAFTIVAGGESQIFLAATDRSSPPRLVVRGGDMVSFGAGQLFFRQLGGKANYLGRVREDGSGLTRILETKISDTGGISPGGEWALVSDIDAIGGDFAVALRDGAQRKICGGACFAQWSADGKYLYVSPGGRKSPGRLAEASPKHTYILPIPHGVGLLNLPASGIDFASDAELAGIQSIPQGDLSPGPDPQTYAYATAAFQGNLFRIPLH